MKRPFRLPRLSGVIGLPGNRRYALLPVVALLAVTSVSGAAHGSAVARPFGVARVAGAARAVPPSARVGALFSGDLEGGHFCTASVVRSGGRDVILTAAHCLSGDGDTDVVFAPGYRNGRAPYGLWRVTKTFVPRAWSDRSDEDSDFAFAVVGSKGGQDLEDAVGANVLVTGRATGVSDVVVTGYPNVLEVPLTCTNRPTVQSRTQQRIECPAFTDGTSGSPWVDGEGEVVGVLGGFEQGGSTDDVSYSAVLGRAAASLYGEASGSADSSGSS
ncbi:serine protease [Streptomyces sp. SID12501]|uniref:Trypsin-like peptidase domain-containing protein n=1 Tax=Streptomyces sp. SID12501 TaxID=2706042 RepID=A0A6B3C3E1_9ACTN|nr:serine protease [Streptomyces sp. SID12501]NEC90926.1 trypsin-like peptidase domain-containing protein [Streptomyces sp. SID12501]